MKKVIALFTLAAVCCLTGCSNVTQIYETDERLSAQTETSFEEQFITLDARTAVYGGEYESFEIPKKLNIQEIIAPVGDNKFVVLGGGETAYTGVAVFDDKREYGIYTLGGEYKALFPEYSEVDSKRMVSTILYCNDEYILYYKAVLNRFDSIASTELVDLYLLNLGDMTEKRIYRLTLPHATNAVICGNAVYLEQEESRRFYDIEDKAMYARNTIVKYDIEKDEFEDFCYCAGADGEDCTILGYLKDGKQFNIFRANGVVSVYDVSFEDGYAVWDCNLFTGWRSKMFPMFYSDEKKSVIVIEDERSNYESLIHDGKIYFFELNEYNSGYERALVLDTENIK